jgi:hypothetical protein
MNFTWIASLSAGSLFLGMVILSVVGRRSGMARLARGSEELPRGVGLVEGAVFALLGLIIALTFAGALSRFQDRRQLIIAEANAIGTAYLRLDLLPDDIQPEMRALFRRYLDSRLAAYLNVEDVTATQTKLAETEALQGEIWTKALSVCCRPESPPSVAMLLLPALNGMFDIRTTRMMANENHPPLIVFILLSGLSLIGAFLVGYGMSGHTERAWLHPVVFAAVLSLALYVIVDLEFPRLGLIRVDAADHVLVELRRSMD